MQKPILVLVKDKGQIAVDVASVWQSGKQVTKSEPECST